MRFCRNSLKFRWPPLVKSSRYRKGKCDFVEIHWENFISRHTYLSDLFFRKWIMRRSSLSTAVVCWINKEREYMGRGSTAVNGVKRFKTMEIRGVNGVLKGFPRIKLSKSDEFDRLGLTFSRWNSGDPSGLLFISSRYRKGKCDFVEIHWNSGDPHWSKVVVTEKGNAILSKFTEIQVTPQGGLSKVVATEKENGILSKFTEIQITFVDQIENRSFDGGCSIGPWTMTA